jgi:hypothetical protein
MPWAYGQTVRWLVSLVRRPIALTSGQTVGVSRCFAWIALHAGRSWNPCSEASADDPPDLASFPS